MKRIAYIELDTHAEIAWNFMELTKDNSDFKVDFYFSEKILEQLGLSTSTEVICCTPKNVMQKLLERDYDSVVIGTAHRYFNLFEKITRRFNASIIAHNLNFVRCSPWVLLKNIFKKEVKYRLKLALKEGLFLKDQVYLNARHLWVLDEDLIPHNRDLALKHLPIFFTKDGFSPTRKGACTIAIPGNVSQQRRDYSRIFQILQEFSPETTITICLLGKVSESMVQNLERIKRELAPQKIELIFFTKYVSQPEFDIWMRRSAFLWCPIQRSTEFFSQKEIYGYTKVTGNLGDAIKYAKQIVFPKTYPTKSSFVVVENENNLQSQFSRLIVGEFAFPSTYTKNSVQNQLNKIILDS